ncbi:restriction endonuclease subunit S [Levilactobacillus zymae]|uniref:restriction endonuclease subunit S n=1 Tax=Levilactobacillus zymae TaxID=267363 RepID=UPI003FCE800C
MKDNQAKYPQLRFKGFTNPWEQRKTKELCDISTGKGNTQDKVKDGKYPFYVRSATIERSNEYLYDQEAVLTVGDGVGTGKVFHYVNGKYNLHQRVYRMFNFNHGVSAKYFYHYFSKNFYRRVMSMTAKTSVDSVRMEMIADMKIKFPSPAEQETIVAVLDGVDDLISLHQRKLAKLKELKQGYLQKMFPKNGAKVPELRFAGFADAWEQRNLRDLLNKNSEKNKNLSVINVESVSNKTGFTKQTEQFEDYSVASADLSNYYVIREQQFAYNPSRINVGSIAYKDLGEETAVVSPLYVSFSTKKVLNDGFLWNWFKTTLFDAQRQRLSEGGVRDTLSFNQLSEMNIIFPTYPEQEKIGAFFKQLDNTITLHQRKLEKLQELKKGYLQKMFC